MHKHTHNAVWLQSDNLLPVLLELHCYNILFCAVSTQFVVTIFCCLCTGYANRPVVSPASSGLPVFSAPGFQPVSTVTKPEVQAVQESRFGVASPAWQPQVNGMPASSIHGAQLGASVAPLPTNTSPFQQQFSRPPAAMSTDAGLLNAFSAPPMALGPPAAIRASPAQVSYLFKLVGAVKLLYRCMHSQIILASIYSVVALHRTRVIPCRLSWVYFFFTC